MSGTALWIVCAVIVVSLAVWLVLVMQADRHPFYRRPRQRVRQSA